MEEPKSLRSDGNQAISNLTNTLITDMKQLSTILKPLSKQSSEMNYTLINKLLLANDRDSLMMTKEILSHLLHIVDYKGINSHILSILTKVISFIKIIQQNQSKSSQKLFEKELYEQEMSNIVYHVIDIIFLLKNKYKENDMVLRIIQTSFSLIDYQILKYVNESLITRIYSICFDCCFSTAIIQNISVSALFALTQIVFSSGKSQDSVSILLQFLLFLINGKRYSWIRDNELKGMVWDLVIVAIKNMPTKDIIGFHDNKGLVDLLNHMYKLSFEKCFKNIQQNLVDVPIKNIKKQQAEKSFTLKKGSTLEFARYYKCVIYFSIHLDLNIEDQKFKVVSFKEYIHLFKLVNELQRNIKLYILLEGINIILVNSNRILIEEEKGILLLDAFCKISEELCLTQVPLEINWEGSELLLEKMCVDFNKITDSDFVRIIKNTLISLRKKFQLSLDKKNIESQELFSARSQASSNDDPKQKMNLILKKRWQKLIRCILKIVRYLTSLNIQQTQNEQAIRKIIIQLQNWFLICPSRRTRNEILEELMNSCLLIDTKLQAIKVSQCVQVGSNIIYGYYEVLDSVGLTTLVKMMAGIKADWDQGKGFEELDEVCLMSERLYSEQKLIKNQSSFVKTIQAFVQCANGLLADLELSNNKEKNSYKKIGFNMEDRIIKMIDYILSKLSVVLQDSVEQISGQWNFLTGFWISFCSSKKLDIKTRTMNHMLSVIPTILKNPQAKQDQIVSTYVELSKLNCSQISKHIINHLKQILFLITSENALIELFHIMTNLCEEKDIKNSIVELSQLQEMLIKQSIFKIKNDKNLILIINSINILSKDKNEQYKVVNLLWSISDHLKMLVLEKQVKNAQEIWKNLFAKIYNLAENSSHHETVQSCMHTFTQTLAESNTIIDSTFFISTIKKVYLELFLITMAASEKQLIKDPNNILEMMKTGIKNFIKLVRKCLMEQMEEIRSVVKITFQKITTFIKQKGDQMAIEYYFEVCVFIDLIMSIKDSEQKIIFKEESQILVLEIEKNHEHFDKKSLCWRKKYEPLLEELKKAMGKDQ